MTCAVDPIAWGEKNRVALATGKTHVWVLARTTRDAPTLSSVPTTARAVLVKWFQGTPLDTQFADAGDAVDDISVLGVTSERPAVRGDDQRRESLDPIPLLAAGPSPPLYVIVRFNYRGYATSLPWPVWTASVSPLRADKLCPTSADWMLVSAAAVTNLPDAPLELTALDKLEAHGGGPLGELASLTKIAGWALAVYLGVQVIGLARMLPSVPRRAA